MAVVVAPAVPSGRLCFGRPDVDEAGQPKPRTDGLSIWLIWCALNARNQNDGYLSRLIVWNAILLPRSTLFRDAHPAHCAETCCSKPLKFAQGTFRLPAWSDGCPRGATAACVERRLPARPTAGAGLHAMQNAGLGAFMCAVHLTLRDASRAGNRTPKPLEPRRHPSQWTNVSLCDQVPHQNTYIPDYSPSEMSIMWTTCAELGPDPQDPHPARPANHNVATPATADRNPAVQSGGVPIGKQSRELTGATIARRSRPEPFSTPQHGWLRSGRLPRSGSRVYLGFPLQGLPQPIPRRLFSGLEQGVLVRKASEQITWSVGGRPGRPRVASVPAAAISCRTPGGRPR
jgi:hypothetical protein